MKRYLLLALLFAVSPTHAAKFVGCREELTKVYHAFQRDSEDADAAYVGLSHEALLELIQKGRLTRRHLNVLGPTKIHFTKEHSASARIIREQSENPEQPWTKEAAVSDSRVDATDLTTFSIVWNRIEKISGKSLSPVGQRMLIKVFESLRPHILANQGVEGVHSLTWQQIRLGLSQAGIEIPRFLESMKLASSDIEDENEVSKSKLISLFLNLPNRAGYVVGLKPSGKIYQNPDHAILRELKTDDIASIEPLGDDEFNYLASLASETIN